MRRLPRFVLHLLWWLTLPLFVLTIPLGREAKRRALKMPEAPGERHGTQGDSPDDLPDDLHPNPAGYQRLGERFSRAVFSSAGLGLG